MKNALLKLDAYAIAIGIVLTGKVQGSSSSKRSVPPLLQAKRSSERDFPPSEAFV